jgi:hypothetical protein
MLDQDICGATTRELLLVLSLQASVDLWCLQHQPLPPLLFRPADDVVLLTEGLKPLYRVRIGQLNEEIRLIIVHSNRMDLDRSCSEQGYPPYAVRTLASLAAGSDPACSEW